MKTVESNTPAVNERENDQETNKISSKKVNLFAFYHF